MATLTRWDPVQEAVTLREAMNRLFEESVVPGVVARTGNGGTFAMHLDLSETADAYFIEAAVPGMKAEDLAITFENGALTLSGEIKQSEASKERNYHRIERRYGRFTRSITLPTTVRGDNITAHLENGVLHLNIPKAEEVKPRRISINVN
ncbi:Hsp20/alpha crystallin family protein [Candidatus Chloroploca sp. M-50]|uniref:Hsp20/alpha crystallin family protein n=1 Tax=Candidatus Chloroploca mongolica TaxID=2528176 RepID=A0ABS4DBJ3_9CHLR|nr:Hsp20/alpha crystallin family protein [Candidatus Chloroploca mongolica]MBP1466827.1 Hsp20/alpha crystallin family protein [Candidatus Chloroploca mongolica]